MTNMIKQCPDGYMTCRRAEAGHGRRRGVCAADQPRTDKSILLEVSATLDKLLREKPNLGAFMGPYNSLGNLRIERRGEWLVHSTARLNFQEKQWQHQRYRATHAR